MVEKSDLSVGCTGFTARTAGYIAYIPQNRGGRGRKFRRAGGRRALENRLQTGAFGKVIPSGGAGAGASCGKSGENPAIIQNFRISTAFSGLANRWALWETWAIGGRCERWINRLFHGTRLVENGKSTVHFGECGGKVRVSGAEVGIFAGRIHALSTDLSTIHRGYPQPVEKWCGKLAGIVGRIGKAARKPVDCRDFSPRSGTEWNGTERGRRRFGKERSVCAVLDVLDDLVDRRFEHGVRRQLALDHGDIGVDGAVVAGEGGADLRQG